MRVRFDLCRSSLAVCGLAVALAWAPTAQADGRDFRHGDSAIPGLPAKDAGTGFRSGVVAVANPYAAEAGARILESGGNAVDAAVAIAYALNVVEPQSAGIGGGGFMLVHLAQGGRFGGKTFAVDTRERAPAGATPGMFGTLNFTQASTSGISVGVPGMVRGTADAVDRWGKLPLSRVLKPAIRLADDGFAATARFVASPNCASATSRAKVYPETAEYFCPGGNPIAEGTIVTNKPLAETSGGPSSRPSRRTRTASSWWQRTPPGRASTCNVPTSSSTTTFRGIRTGSSSASAGCTGSARPRSATCGTSSRARLARRRCT